MRQVILPEPGARARLMDSLESGRAHSMSIGAADLDVAMARHHGWTNDLIASVYEGIAALVREAHRQVAVSRGYHYTCPNCECWTVTPPQPCHLCRADEDAASNRAKET